MGAQPLAAQLAVAARADRADIEGLGLQRLEQRQVVELGVVRDGHDGGARVGPQPQDQVVGHFAADLHAVELPARALFLARVADDDLEAQPECHLAQKARQVAGTDHDQPRLRPQAAAELVRIEPGQAVAPARAQFDFAGLQVEHPFGAAALLAGQQQFGQPAARRHRLQHQFDRAAAGQAEAVRLVGRDAVAQQAGPLAGADGLDAAGLDALDQVVLDAAARDRADGFATAVDGHQRAGRPWR